MRSFAEIPGELRRRVRGGERVALVLLDALGLRLLERERDHPLVQRLAMTPLQSQFPSTTTAHVTTMHLGVPVETHGLYEWRVLEPTLGEIICPLRWRGAYSSIDEDLVGRLVPAALVPGPTFFQSLDAPACVLAPDGISGSVFTRASTAGARVIGYGTLVEGMAAMGAAFADPTSDLRFAYLYWPDVDAAGHRHGPSSAAFRAAARNALDAVWSAADALRRSGVTLLLTADHGQLDVSPERVDYLDLLWPELIDRLSLARPAGSARDVFLHVRPGEVDAVIDGLAERLGDAARVCRARDLFERAPIGERLASRLGDVCVLPAPGRQAWLRSSASVEAWMLGQHGGLSTAETAVYLAQLVG